MPFFGLTEESRSLENRVRRESEQVSVLGEIELSDEEYERLRGELHALFRRFPGDALETVFRRGKYSTAAFLVEVGAREYGREGAGLGLWPHVAEALDLGDVPGPPLGRLVEDVVFRSGLARFPRAEGGRRYIDLILFHGGVPVGCLDNYFDRVLRHVGPGSSGASAMAAALEPSQRRYLLRPVARYLQYGGELAEDFVERTADLVEQSARLRAAAGGSADAAVAAAVGLPRRVVRKYREWLGTGPAPHERADGPGRSDWAAPALRFDAERLDPVVDLPAQRVDSDAGGEWTVRHGDGAAVVGAPGWRREAGWRTPDEALAVPTPEQAYAVTWASPEGDAAWTLPGPSLRRPLLVFHARDGRAVDVVEGIPCDVVWVVRAEAEDPTCGGARRVEGPYAMAGGWDGFVVERWDLSGCPATASFGVGGVAVPLLAGGDVRPYLEGHRVPGVTAGGAPVYDEWPSAVVPRARADEEAGQWTLQWTAGGEDGGVALEDVAVEVDGAHAWRVDLAGAGVPGRLPVTVRLRGALGRGARFTFVVMEGLDVEGNGRLYLPGEEGPPPVDVRVTAPAGLHVEAGSAESDGPSRSAALRVAPHERSAQFRVRGGGEDLALVVGVPRLRAHLYDAAVEGASTAASSASVVQVQGDWLDQAALPRVTFWTDPSSAAVDALEVDFGGGDVAECPGVGRGATFDLAELAEATAGRRAASARLLARVGHRRARIGEWRASLGLGGLRAVAVEGPAGCSVRASWDRGRLVGGVVARLWPVWSPWDGPLSADVTAAGPSSCGARFGDVPAGDYLLELAVEDPWAPGPVRRPAADAPEVAAVAVGSPADRARRVEEAEGVRGRVVQYLAASGDRAGRSAAWRRACEEAEPGDVGLLLSVAGIEAGEGLGDRLRQAHDDRLFDLLEPVVDRDRRAVLGALRGERSDVLAAYAVHTGYLDGPPGDWGGDWVPLAFCGLDAEALADPIRARAVAERLGLEAAGTPERDEQGGEPEVDLAAMRARRSSFGDPPAEVTAHLGRDQLRAIRLSLGIVPGGPLSGDAQVAAYADWSVARAGDAGPSSDLAAHAAELKRDLQRLRGLDPDRFGPAVDAALGREHALATGGDRPRWLNAPFCAGAAAVLLRAQALDERARRALDGHRRWVRAVAVAALRAAPSLLAHDLCWAHLELLDAPR